MDTRFTQTAVEKLIMPFLEERGVELVKLHMGGSRRILLRLFVDRPEGITIDECARLSRELADLMDTHDPINGSYLLEVSSPGLDRVLKSEKDFSRSVGKLLKLVVEGRGTLVGTLRSLRQEDLDLELNDEVVQIDRSTISKANLHFEF